MKKIGVYLSIIAIILFIIIGAFIFKKGGSNNENNENLPDVVIIPKLELRYSLVDNCKKSGECDEHESTYYYIEDYNKNPDLIDILRDINSIYINRKNNIINNKYSFDECEEKSSVYNYRFIDQGFIYYYSNNEFTVITQDLIAKDICTMKLTTPSFRVYYYDVKRQKEIDEKAFLELLKIDNKKVEDKIIEFLLNKKIIENANEYEMLTNNNKLRCNVFLTMVGELVSKCVYFDDLSYDDFLLFNSSELGLTIKFDE